ncbi:hypothetical protein H5410_018525 [Solanum commersonii]|uniref:Protein tweety homolog n=1 Tax=Solanum commersonii TaxID=4109 RepID=A0A9J6A2A1_SOLCO|nr:hypothetical protein H5410_018525 [Solanum commersonii]
MSYTKINSIPLTVAFSLLLVSALSLSFALVDGVVSEPTYGVVSSVSKRFLAEDNATGNASLVLAAERTHRRDPLEDRSYYTGGWNISSSHYWASVAYTGAPLFIIALFWFVACGISLLLVCICCCCCRRGRYGYSRTAYALSLILLSAFTIAAIIGSIFLYTGQGKFHDGTKHTLDYVVQQAGSTVDNLRNVSNILAVAKHTGISQIFLPQNVQTNIDKVDTKISSAAETLETETEKNKKNIMIVLDLVRRILIIVAAVMLGLAALGFLLSILGLQFIVYILVIIGWILVAVTFILCGAFLVLHKILQSTNLILVLLASFFVCSVIYFPKFLTIVLSILSATGDTCVAMDDWVKNPSAHTALDDIIPCVDTATAQETLSQSKEVTYQLVGVTNTIITNVSNINLPPGVGYNQSGPLVPNLCNPFNSDKTDRKCASGEVELSNATQVWRNYVCEVSASNMCSTVGRLTPSMYDQMTAVVNVSNGLYHSGPFLKELLDCTFLRDTFTVIHDEHCPDLSRYSKWIYIGLALVSVSVMLSLICWVLYARERRHRKYTKLVDATSGQESLAGKSHG